MAYEVQQKLRPKGLDAISDEQIAQHWKLYEGYVAQVNALRSELETLRREGKGNTPLYADRRRRLGFEYNGMVLHEYYFGNLAANAGELSAAGELAKLLVAQFGSLEQFREDYLACGATRSIGWAILAFDPQAGAVNNHFVHVHEEGNIAGFVPLLVMDVWEHAYMVDYGATGRPQYMQAFWRNINWPVVEKRFADAVRGVIPRRF